MNEPARELALAMFTQEDEPAARVVPAGRWRDWMNATPDRFANRCLPLLMANQSGWVLLNPAPFRATWNGDDDTTGLRIDYDDDVPERRRIAQTHFGFGILTFRFRDLIQTPPGWNLLARGPTNSPKDGICALDGLIETDWSAALFTMNWKLTRPGTVEFAEDEPFCQIMPQRRGELERFRPVLRRLGDDAPLGRRARAWEAARAMIVLGRNSTFRAGSERWRRYWLEDYFKGKAPTGETGADHQTTLRLAEFKPADVDSSESRTP